MTIRAATLALLFLLTNVVMAQTSSDEGGATTRVCQLISANPPRFNPFQFIPKVADFAALNLHPQVSFAVNKDGSVSNVKVLKGTGSSDVDAGLVKSIRAWKYKPQTGCTIDVSMSVVIDIGQP